MRYFFPRIRVGSRVILRDDDRQPPLRSNDRLTRTKLINLFNSAARGAVLYLLADDNSQINPINNRALIDAAYNRAFVFTQYFGSLRRDADIGGFLFWLGQVNSGPLRDTAKQHAMVCSFITPVDYRQRFSSLVTHSNADCGPRGHTVSFNAAWFRYLK